MHQLFFTLLLVLLPTQLGYHFWPQWAMVLGRRVDYLSPTFYLTDILIFLLLLFKFPKLRITAATLGVLLCIAINIYFAASPWVAVYTWLKVLEYVLLGLYIVKAKPKFSSVVFYLSIGILYSSVIAISQFFLQRSVGGPLWFLGERTFALDTPGIARTSLWGREMLRPYATFPHPNVLGGFLAITLPLIVTQFKKRKIFYSTTLLLGVSALVLTFSRSAWIAAMFGILILSLTKKFFVPLLAFAAVIIFFIVGSFGLQDESVVVRQQLNASATTMFGQSPIIGKGLGNFLVELPKSLSSREIYFLQPVHNIYLLLLSEIGIVGVGLIGYLVFSLLNHESRIMNNEKNKKEKFIIHYSLFIILLLGFVDHYFLTLQQGQLLLTILLACTIAL